MMTDAAMAKEWGVTPEQNEKLKTVRGGSGLNPSNAERAAMEQLWMGYAGAASDSARGDAQKKITDKLEEIAKANVDAAKKAYAERVEQVKSILTSEQVAKITKP
jgi:Spy/CpxP family protein refolding chaperone